MKRLLAVLLFSCTPAAAPSFEAVDATVSSEPGVRRLSDLIVHADGSITYADVEQFPQRISSNSKPIVDAVSNEAGVVGADRVVASLRPGFRTCYNKGLQTDRDMAGRVVFAIKIPPDGKYPTVEQSGGSGLSAEVVACIKRKIEATEFDPPGGSGSTLQVPITFVQQGKTFPQQPSSWPAALLDFDALRVCNTTARSKNPFVPTNATFTIDDGTDVGFDVRVDPFEGDQELLACTANVVGRIERGAAPRPFVFRILFVP